jgi:hypothetical protein
MCRAMVRCIELKLSFQLVSFKLCIKGADIFELTWFLSKLCSLDDSCCVLYFEKSLLNDFNLENAINPFIILIDAKLFVNERV